jgi:HD-GYP domain-containing protein (c-di-GMP phosphodiesterase class II)
VLILPTEEARPGMKLAAPVQHPDQPDQVLLKGGYILERDVIQRMQDMRIPMIYIDYPGLEELDKHLAPYLSPARQDIYSKIKKSLAKSQSTTQAKVNYNDYCDSTRGLIETLLTQGKHPLFLDQMSRLGGDMVGHATSVAHLALLLGIRLENYLIDQRKRLPCSRAKDIVGLGVAGMLHDVGKTELPANVAQSWETSPPQTQDDLDLYMTHVRLGYDKIHGEVEPTAASAVLHHHQHFDGSGFPDTPHADGSDRALEGQRIHIFARILHAADLYDRLATSPTGERRTNVEVYFQMRTRCSGWVDPVIVQVLQQIAPPFPPGSTLGLSDGTAAVVTQTGAIDPYKPVVRRVVGEDLKLDGNAFDLGMNGSPKVVKVGKTIVESFLPVAA